MESMRNLLRHSIARSLEAMPELDRLEAAWTVACGRALAAHGVLTSFDNGHLRIEVDDKVWLDQLNSMRAMLERELERISGIPVTAIHFQLRKPTA
jgi:hypothetical protein